MAQALELIPLETMAKKNKKRHNDAGAKKKKKNKENKKNAMDIVPDSALSKVAKKKNTNAPLVFGRPKGPKGARAKNVVLEVKGDNMKRIHAVQKAHKDSITQLVYLNGSVYTCSLDGALKRWVPIKDNASVSLQENFSHDIGAAIWSILVTADEKTIFCGLSTGSIRVLSIPNLAMHSLESHDKRVTAVIAGPMSSILSGSLDGTVKIWELVNGAFACKLTIQMAGEVRSLLLTTEAATVVLWVGTAKGLYAVNLANPEQAPVKVANDCTTAVSCMREYSDTVVVGLKDGSLKCFSKSGRKMADAAPYPDCKNLTALAIVYEKTRGNRLVCGFNEGRLSSFDFPKFERRARWDAFDKHLTSSVCACQDGYYVVGSQIGDLHLWKLVSIVDEEDPDL